MGLTTNWTEENKFHPCCILSVFMKQSLPPFGDIGVSELLSYMVDGKRDSHADDRGKVYGFHFNIVPRLQIALPYLQQQFPEMATYAEQISSIKMKIILSSQRLTQKWVEGIVLKFGMSVQVDEIKAKNICDDNDVLTELQFKYLELNKPLFAIWWSTDKTTIDSTKHIAEPSVSLRQETSCSRLSKL
ncbi:hypothetical protein CC99x_007050 [Candidatus Berkiella cookevillensis]|uniref:Uncharacterized protein n=1 Tax=Candidatus Berkiella cookevillensis TaxID=437022 RepID=A0A0Q9YCF5_9GAMM|nr:hypothetical protein [Candidatus Berkiella cookevillensis]MCS5708663.1 hypothetical protein [Candidatus Berkiella cookevillensis]